MALNSNFRTLTADNIEGIVDDRNYLKSSFENGTITGWTEVAVALTSGLPTGTPTIGATAASSLALSATSVTPLSGSRSLLVDVPSALTAGHGFISDEFTLDRMDLGKVLTVSFDYERVTGTYNFSGTLGSQTWMVYVYDATAGGANWIQPAGFLGMNQSSGPGRVRATFQSSVTAGQKYRVAVIASQAASGASSIEFDNFTCSRQTAPIGPVVTDWVNYTPTFTLGSGSLTNYSANARWRRVGDSIEVMGKIIFSAASAGFSQIYASMPTGINIDSTKLTSGLQSVIGQCAALDFGIANYTGGSVFYQSANLVYLAPSAINSHVGTAPVFTPGFSNTFPITFNTNDEISWHFMAPISGWSSNVQLSNDTDTRVVDFRAYTTTARTVNNSAPTIIFENVEKDSHGAYNASTGVYTVPVSGDYVVSGQMRIGSLTMTAGAFFGFSAAVDGIYTVRHHYTAFRAVVASSAFNYAEGSGSVLLPNLRAGQTIQVRAWGDNATATFTDGANTFCIQRISGPSVVAASETVAARAYKRTGTHITTANTLTVASWNNKEYDTHNAFDLTTGEFRVPVSGTYHVSGTVSFVANTTSSRVSYVRVNGANRIISNVYLNFADNPVMPMSGTLRLNAGDVVTLAAFQASGGALNYDTTVVDVADGRTQFNIVRVGN